MEERKIKVLRLTNNINMYSVPTLNIISKKVDLTVLYFEKENIRQETLDACEFKTIYSPAKQYGRFIILQKNIRKLCNKYDVVISIDSIQILSYSLLSLMPRKFKLIYWSIGAPASRQRHYGEASKLYYVVSHFFEKRADALIFYSQAAVDLHNKQGFKGPRMFVAPNTTKAIKRELDSEPKESILFIGKLYLEKGLQLLLDAYKMASQESSDAVPLIIVGGGKPLENIRKWVKDNKLEHKISVAGPIYSDEEKADIFMRSIACISPLQGGLSVLESMGYGVPYITDANAITGGEAFDIIDGINGLRVKDMSVEKLKDIILDIMDHKEKYYEMGRHAYEFYWEYRTIEHMAKGVLDAIEYVYV